MPSNDETIVRNLNRSRARQWLDVQDPSLYDVPTNFNSGIEREVTGADAIRQALTIGKQPDPEPVRLPIVVSRQPVPTPPPKAEPAILQPPKRRIIQRT